MLLKLFYLFSEIIIIFPVFYMFWLLLRRGTGFYYENESFVHFLLASKWQKTLDLADPGFSIGGHRPRRGRH